jgi:L-threonylcarbamoyladenylate synthase
LQTRVAQAGDRAIADAARVLAAGGLVAFPTETVYGLGADAGNAAAVARLFAAKARPSFNPLIAHVGSLVEAKRIAQFDADAERLATTFWPGPLTLVLPKTADCPVAMLATAGLDTIAVRVPDHPVAQNLLHAFGGPLVAPSANQSGHVSPTTAQHVLADLAGKIDLIIDDGPTSVGLESSIVACTGSPVALLRPGGVPRDAIERALGRPLRIDIAAPNDTVIAPGALQSHYAPKARMRLEATTIAPGEAVLAFGAAPPGSDQAKLVLNLSPQADLVEAAANLFSYLRRLDASGAAVIAATPIPHTGLGEAINDRLTRGAAPR